MEANDLLGLLRRLGNHWQSQKRDVPELFLVLDAWERGGKLSFDLPSVARQLGTSRDRLERRLSRLAPMGVLYLSDAEQGSINLVGRAPSSDRLGPYEDINTGEEVIHNSLTVGEEVIHNSPTVGGCLPRARGAGVPRARGAGAQLRARGCSVLKTSSVLSSLAVLAPGKRVPFLAYDREDRPWAWTIPSVAAEVVHVIGGDLSTAQLPATLDAVYSAADYLGGAAHVLPVVEAAVAAPAGGSFRGWGHYLRVSLPEHLTRRTMLDEYSAKRKPNEERKERWRNQCDEIPQLRTLEVLTKRQFGPHSVGLLSPHKWTKKGCVLSFDLATHYPPSWRKEYLKKMEPVFTQAQALTELRIV